jgi:signal transduction histidine kinase/HAMP domain-containing protein
MRASVAFKIFVGFAVVLVAFAMVISFSIYKMDQGRTRLELISATYVPLTQVLTKALSEQDKEAELLKNIQDEPQQKRRKIRGIPDDLTRIKTLLNRAPAASSPFDKNVLKDIQTQMESISNEVGAYLTKRTELLKRLTAGETPTQDLLKELVSQQEDISKKYESLLESTQRQTRRAADLAGDAETNSSIGVAILSLIALVIGVGIAALAHFTLRPLGQLAAATNAVGRGEEPGALPVTTQDEIGELAREFAKMVLSLKTRDQKIREKHDALATLTRFHSDIIRSMSTGLIVINKDGLVRGANPAGIALFGLDLSQVEGAAFSTLPAFTLLPKQFQAQIKDEIGLVLKGESGKPLRALPYQIQHKEKLIDLRVVPFADAFGDIEGVLLLGEDATEEIKTKERLIQSERLATVGRMAAQVAHEIRNPLSSIGLNAELLEDDLSEVETLSKEANLSLPRLAQDQKLLKAIQSEVDRLAAITEDYLRYARLPRPQAASHNLNQMIKALCDFCAEEARSRKVQISLSLSPEISELRFDESQIKQSLLNLLRNAFEALQERGGEVKITTSIVGLYAQIEISDNGPGIEPEVAARIFEPFFSTKNGGTGLGLALTQQVIEGHGGHIKIKSTPGEGATFLIQLPM